MRALFLLARSKRELIVMFLAFLEMVKYAEISLIQRAVFGDIFARKRENEVAPVEILDTYEKPAADDAPPEAAPPEFESNPL